MWTLSAILTLVLIGGAPSATILPAPPELHITVPAANLPPEVAAFSGTWEGAWDDVLPSRLVVEEIDTESARVVYAWADHPQGRFQAGWSRVRVKVLPGGTLQWGSDGRFTFTMARDRLSINGKWEEAEHIATVIMKKIEPE
jgi:hypothetical protein